MKGLLLKDWYLICSYCRAFLFVILAFLGASLFARGFSVFVIYPSLFAALLPITLYSYDEREKWTAYSGVLPVSRGTYVSGKYLVGLFAAAAVLLLNGIARAAAELFAPGYPANELPMLLTASALGLLGPAVVLPLMFRFGAEKARIFYYILVGAITAISIVLLDNDGAPSVLETWSVRPAVLLAAALALYAASWLLSAALFRKREL